MYTATLLTGTAPSVVKNPTFPSSFCNLLNFSLLKSFLGKVKAYPTSVPQPSFPAFKEHKTSVTIWKSGYA